MFIKVTDQSSNLPRYVTRNGDFAKVLSKDGEYFVGEVEMANGIVENCTWNLRGNCVGINSYYDLVKKIDKLL